MKSLLKLNLICLLAFFATNALHAQCNMTMSIAKVAEYSGSVHYRIQATTPQVVDRIVLPNVNKTCYDTRWCHGYKIIQKGCTPKNVNFECESVDASCIQRDGCIVVIEPLYNCGS